MSIRTRFTAFLAVLAAVAMSLAPLGAADATRPSLSSRTNVVPKVGQYDGRDASNRHIRFHYGSHGQITTFRIEHTNFPPATVQGTKWYKTCHNNHCTRGHWTSDTAVTGHWSIGTRSGDVSFSASWVGE